MNAQITLGWFVVPGVLGSLLGSTVAALWNHLASKELRLVESRLRKQEESFRLSQSPRVTAATTLWVAFCDYERWLQASFIQFHVAYVPAEAPPEEQRRASDEQRHAWERRVADELKRSWREVTAARDKAEVLLPPGTFERFDDAFKAYDSAHSEQWSAEVAEVRGNEAMASHKRVAGYLDAAKRARAQALGALRKMIDEPETVK